jgi:hypothetical protein
MSLHGPQTAGIPEKTRVTYVPHAEPIIVNELGAGTTWRATQFDPATGREKSLGLVKADANGTRTFAPPQASDHDWVLVLQRE